MTALIVIAAIVLFFAILLSLKIKVFVKQSDSLTVKCGLGPIMIRIMPKKEKKVKLSDFSYKKHQKRLKKEKAKAEQKKLKKAERDRAKAIEKKAKEIEKKSADAAPEEKIASIGEIISFASDEFPKLFSYFHTDIRHIDITVGGKDAAKVATTYGAVCASVALLIELLKNKTAYKARKNVMINVRPDFTLEKTKASVTVQLGISIFSLLRVAVHSLKWYIKQLIRAESKKNKSNPQIQSTQINHNGRK